MNQDNSDLIKLIIERFDDLNHRVDRLESNISLRYAQHEQDDKDRFIQVQAELEPLKKAKWSNASAAGVSATIITFIAEVIRQYLAK